ncbi:MAG: hypothetical protein QW607_11230 [Desulfurococcaceae archaeon]
MSAVDMIVKLPPFSTYFTYVNSGIDPSEIRAVVDFSEKALHEIEYDLILMGVRHCNYTYIDPLKPDELVQIHKRNLKYKIITYVKRFSGFAHTHEQPQGFEDALAFVAVCDTDENTEKMAKAYLEGDHVTQGHLLGYPEDDIEFFVKHWGHHLDLVYPTALNSEKRGGKVVGYPELNVLLRYVGPRVIPFFPHSYTCPHAKKFGDKVVELLKDRDPDMTKKLLWLLSRDMHYSQVNGIIRVDVVDSNKRIMTVVASGYTSERQEFILTSI